MLYKTSLIILSLILLFFGFEPKSWRGIEPLISTRLDVEHLLGPCPKKDLTSCLYKTDKEMVMVWYSDGPCDRGWPFGYDVPLDTVIRVEVSPMDYVHVSALDVKLDGYSKKINNDGSLTYSHEEQGVTLQVFDGKVGSISYGPTSAQNRLYCGNITYVHGAVAKIADPHERLMSYGAIKVAEEVKILTSFSELLRNQPNTQGYIIVYAGQESLTDEAARRLQCQTDYITKRWSIPRQQLTTIDGGYREKAEVELYIVPKDSPVLLPFPTVRPSHVTVVPETSSAMSPLALCNELIRN